MRNPCDDGHGVAPPARMTHGPNGARRRGEPQPVIHRIQRLWISTRHPKPADCPTFGRVDVVPDRQNPGRSDIYLPKAAVGGGVGWQ